MATVDYKPLANNVGANVVDQATFLLLLGVGGALVNGFQDGIAHSEHLNKVLRQCSMVSAALAQVVSDVLGIDVLDDGNLPALIANLKSAILGSAWSTGDAKLTFKTVADPGWIIINDGSIGSAASGATTRANADTQALYTLLWNNVTQAWAPVAGGRGANAAADFAANRALTIPLALGRAIAIAGAGVGLTARALGEVLGEEAHILTAAEQSPQAFQNVIGVGGGGNAVPDGTFHTAPFGSAPNAHNNLGPRTHMNIMLKL